MAGNIRVFCGKGTRFNSDTQQQSQIAQSPKSGKSRAFDWHGWPCTEKHCRRRQRPGSNEPIPIAGVELACTQVPHLTRSHFFPATSIFFLRPHPPFRSVAAAERSNHRDFFRSTFQWRWMRARKNSSTSGEKLCSAREKIRSALPRNGI